MHLKSLSRSAGDDANANAKASGRVNGGLASDSPHPDWPLLPPAALKWQKQRTRRGPWTATIAAFATLALVALLLRERGRPLSPLPWRWTLADPAAPSPPPKAPGGDDSFRWADIPASRSLVWHPCYASPGPRPRRFDCARLDVPMDWRDPSDALRVVLAIIRLRAASHPPANSTASHGGAAYRGPIIFNPGGPGGSGIWALRDHGVDLQTIVGDDYDIVSFDPRGVGASTPRIECWAGNARDRAVWELQDVGNVDAHPGVLYDAFARAGAFSRMCEATLGEEGILRHSSTSSHARDMLEIWQGMGEEKIRYWGFSYGTVLGGTFAAMYPDKVERMVNDGNVDYKEWYYGSYINFLHDTDKVMDAFYEFCHQAGPLRCAFYAPTPQLIRIRLDTLLSTIRMTPVLIPPSPASPSGPDMPELVTYSKVKRMLSTALYQPVYRFRRVAAVLAALEHGDGAPYHAYTAPERPSLPTFCPADDTLVPPFNPGDPGPDEDTPDAFPAIMCSDAEVFNESVSEFEAYALRLQEISSAAGAVQTAFRLSCVGRSVRPKWRFDGPFEAKNTSFPLLFVNNLADNVTPLVSARNNSAGFEGSVLLMQNSYGHTSLTAASRCTAEWVRRYFREGRMPPAGTVCEADVVPFGDNSPARAEGDELSAAVRRLAEDGRWGDSSSPNTESSVRGRCRILSYSHTKILLRVIFRPSHPYPSGAGSGFYAVANSSHSMPGWWAARVSPVNQTA
ncbi:TAP-like protein-domain-containing protein [Lasiosphaeris hirsuta]|uniref:TAP-like protein-domain-containing protein n=1 Tax=Lasiosphaeris hirsuta TaxID=260670 RepID=A0AA40B9K3_9PEZI|nr:TAP-like protein-domain-containing protein [Lasiosphaeris hirsuta]